MHVSVSAGLKLVEEKPFMTSFDCALPHCKNSIIKIFLKGAFKYNILKKFERFWNQKTLEIQPTHRTKNPQTNLKMSGLSLFTVLME